MTDIQQFVSNHTDFQFLPISKNKMPACKTWSHTDRAVYDFTTCFGIGLICGTISNEVETLDIDLKYDLTGTLYERLKKAITKADKTILPKLVVQKTPNGGYHFIYKCTERTKNTKLARRLPSDDELNKNPDEKVKVLIETRGDGGYIGCYPTPGYELVFGTFDKINYITPEQRKTIFDVAGTFNEYFEEYRPVARQEKKQIKGLTPFEDYNNRADVVYLLEQHGWTAKGTKGRKTFLLRPGDSKADHSGNYDAENNWFSVFSTSTQFEPEKGYLPYAVFAVLECDKDFSVASRRLYALGYGDRVEKTAEIAIQTPSKVDLLDDDLSFIATEPDYLDYLKCLRNGTFKKGQPTGIKALDPFFLFKENNFVTINGHDNVGKSVVIWYLSLLSALLYGWKWIIFSSENTVGGFYRKMIEFYWCEPIETMGDQRYNTALEFIKLHFKVILSDDEMFNYRDIINMSKKVMKVEKIYGLLIDPYNSLKIELATNSKLNTHEYHYEAVSELKLFGKRDKIAIYINCHAITTANRTYGKDGMVMPPQKGDTEGGSKFANKTDDFLTIHRKVQSPDEWMITEIYVRKIKEVETGGKVTPFNAPVKLKSVNCLTGFCDLEGYNAILEYHKISYTPIKIQPSLNFSEPVHQQMEIITPEQMADEDVPF